MRAVTVGFAGDEAFEIAAFVVADFVIDNPAGAVFIDKAAVENEMPDLLMLPFAQWPLAAGMLMLAGKNPLAVAAAKGVVDGTGAALHGLLQQGAGKALTHQ